MAAVTFSFRNSLHHIHNVLVGPTFESVHSYFGDLYDKILDYYDYWRERAEQEGEKVPNMNHIMELPAAKAFPEANEKQYDVSEAYGVLIELGKEYLDALEECREDMPNNIQSDIDEMYSWISNEVEYKAVQVLEGL